MLAVKQYSKGYIDACYTRMEDQLAAYRVLTSGKASPPRAVIETFESLFFNNLIVVLDAFFVHRTRAMEGKDGSPLNEVRMLSSSILNNEGVLTADKTIRYKPDAAVLKLHVGAEIRIEEADFVRLFKAFFGEIRRRFS